MKQYIASLIQRNYFFLSLLLFVCVLPLSTAFVSISAGAMLLTALIEDNWANKRKRFSSRKIILCIPAIFALYLLSTLWCINVYKSFYDVQKTMFYLVIPLAFAFGKPITKQQKRFLFQAFGLSIFVATVIAIINWLTTSSNATFTVHKASLISHIRFGFQLILMAWFLIYSLELNFKKITVRNKLLYLVAALYFIGYLFFQQSLTGILALLAGGAFFAYYLLKKLAGKRKRTISVAAIVILIVPVLYIGYAIHKFYDIETVNPDTIEKLTKQGNRYDHYFEEKMVENGHYVHLYICNDEMRMAWNARSEMKFDSLGSNGFPVHATLKRYLTSKGLRKDAEGVAALSGQDVQNVEAGIANVIFTRKFSLYPRIYQTIWEYYVYSTSGNSNYQSFSQRIEFAKAAITIIKKNPWFGVGTGNWKQEFRTAFIENKSQLDESLYASSHNQYLNYTVKFGVLGFALILFLIVFPVVWTKSYRDPLFLTFLIFMAFANLADSNLESHMGSSFFFFFYCFFITTRKTKYLEVEQ